MSEQLNEIALGQNAWLTGVLLRWKLKSDYPELGHLGVGIWKNLKFRWQEHQWWCIPAQLRVEFCTFSCSSGCWNLKVSRAGCCLNWRRERWDSRIKYFCQVQCSPADKTTADISDDTITVQGWSGFSLSCSLPFQSTPFSLKYSFGCPSLSSPCQQNQPFYCSLADIPVCVTSLYTRTSSSLHSSSGCCYIITWHITVNGNQTLWCTLKLPGRFSC